MSDRIFLNRAVRDLQESPEFQPISKVRIISGTDEDGNEIAYEAGTDGWRTLDVEMPWGSQEIAQAILNRVKGYAYKPYTASGAILNPAAEIGDAVTVGDVYSVIASNDTPFDSLMAATISAPEDSNIDHEFPYYEKTERETVRRFAETEDKIDEAKATFEVGMNEIRSQVRDTYQTKGDAAAMMEELESSIVQTASSITATVARYQLKYAIPDEYNVTLFGYGDPDDSKAYANLGQYYLDQETGNLWKALQNRWQKVSGSPFPLITTDMESKITQTAAGITQTVAETYETKAEAAAGVEEAKAYARAQDNEQAAMITAAYRSAIEQSAREIRSTVAASETKYDLSQLPDGVTISVYGYGAPSNATAADYEGEYYLNQSAGIYYYSNGTKWIKQNGSGTNQKALPLISSQLNTKISQTADGIMSTVSETYQTISDADDKFNEVNQSISAVEQTAKSITLSVTSERGQTVFKLEDNNGTLATETLDLTVKAVNISGTLTADAVRANATINAPRIYGGTFYNSDGDASLLVDDDLIFDSPFTFNKSYHAFEIRDYTSSMDMRMHGEEVLEYSDDLDTVFGLGNWQFGRTVKFTGTVDLSEATVIE